MFASPRTVSVALAATLVFAACGSDDGGDTDSTVSETTVAATTAESAPETTPETTEAMTDDTTATTVVDEQDVDADSAAAQAALLTLADLPEGWTEAPAADGETSEIDELLGACVEADSLTSSETAAVSAAFTNPDGNLVVVQNVGVQATERDARNVVARLTDPEVPDCVAAAYSTAGAEALSAVPADAEIGEVTASRLAVGAAGDATQAIRVTIPVTADGAATPLTLDLVAVRAGTSLSTITFEALGEPATVEGIDEITAAAAARLPA